MARKGMDPIITGHVTHRSNGVSITSTDNWKTIIPLRKRSYLVTLSALQTNTDIFSNSVYPDEMAHREPSHLDVHCLPFCFCFVFCCFFFVFCFVFFTDILFAMMGMPKLKDGSVHFRNSGVKGLIEKGLCSCLHRAGPEVIKLFFHAQLSWARNFLR